MYSTSNTGEYPTSIDTAVTLYTQMRECWNTLQTAFCDLEVDAIYLLSDGKPDTSTQHVLKEVAKMNENRKLKVHTMSFHCDDKSANSFLKVVILIFLTE